MVRFTSMKKHCFHFWVFVFMLVPLFINNICFSQKNEATEIVTKVSLQASGLTCSMCSNAVNKSLKSIDFVDKIEVNLKTSTFEITFKQGHNVDFDKLKKKVEDAGFSVSTFIAYIHFNNIQVKGADPVTIGTKTFRFLNVRDLIINGDKAVKIVDRGFVSSKEYKRGSTPASNLVTRIYNATI